MKRISRQTRVAKGDQKAHDIIESEEEKVVPEEYPAKKAVFRTYQVVWYILGFIEVLLAFRFIFKLFGANPESPFVSLIYALSFLFAAPFRGIFSSPSFGDSAFETSTLIAMLVYLVLAWGIVKILQIIKPVDPEDVETAVDQY